MKDYISVGKPMTRVPILPRLWILADKLNAKIIYSLFSINMI